MGLLDRLFGRKAPREIEDEELGTLRLRGASWQGELLLSKPRIKLLVMLEGDATGPSDRSRKEVKRARKRWSKFVRTTLAKEAWKIDEECRDDTWPQRDFSRETVLDAYKVVGATITVSATSTELEVDLAPPEDESHTMTLHFVDWKPAGMHLDG